jgi:hypothetical protein
LESVAKYPGSVASSAFVNYYWGFSIATSSISKINAE